MSPFLLTPASIGYLTQFVLALSIAVYLWYLAIRTLRARSDRAQPHTTITPSFLLAGALTAYTGLVLEQFLNDSLLLSYTFYILPLGSLALAWCLCLFLFFAYRFPLPLPISRGERYALRALVISYVLMEAGITLYRYLELADGHGRYHPKWADIAPVLFWGWIVVTFVRQTAYAARTADASKQNVSWLHALGQGLARPSTRAARTTHAFLMLSLAPLAFQLVVLASNFLVWSSDAVSPVVTIGTLFCLFGFVLVYTNFIPETTSFMLKLVGISLTSLLAILGCVAWVITPPILAIYRDTRGPIAQQTLRFSPNAAGGQDIAVVPLQYESDLGAPVDMSAETVRMDLPFVFDLFQHAWGQVYVSQNGVVSFHEPLSNVKLGYGPHPAIFTLHQYLGTTDAAQSDGAGVFVKSDTARFIVTWHQMPARVDGNLRYTVQLVLYPNGMFDITFQDLPAQRAIAITEPREAPWLIGATPGTLHDTALQIPQTIQLATDLPFHGGPAGAIQDYYLDLRQYLDRAYTPLAWVVIVTSLFILFCFPLFFRRVLVVPLNALLDGVREMNKGNLAVVKPVLYPDEIGFLTRSFNDMAAGMKHQTETLRRQAMELEMLADVSTALRRAPTFQELLETLCAETVRALNATVGAVLVNQDDTLLVAAVSGLPRALIGQTIMPEHIPCMQTQSIEQRAESLMRKRGYCATSKPVSARALETPAQNTCIHCAIRQLLAPAHAAQIVMPIYAQDQVLGFLHAAFENAEDARPEQLVQMTAIAEMSGNALQRLRTMEMLEQLVADRTRELAALYQVAQTTTRYLDAEVVLNRALSQAVAAVGAAGGAIHLATQQGCLFPAARYGDLDENTAALTDASPHMQAMQKQDTVKVLVQASDNEPARVCIATPLRAPDAQLGVLSVMGHAGQSFSDEEIALLSGISNHIAVAVENVRLQEQASQIAIQAERRRLARDLHDSVTQSLHSLVLSADTASFLLAHEQYTALQGSLSRLSNSATQALKEMRLLLYELHLDDTAPLSLERALKERLAAVEQHAGIKVEFDFDKQAVIPEGWDAELYYLAIEALNNALRHARATQVTVCLRASGDWLELQVTDDGKGFDPARANSGGMGLQNMRERARRLGGELTIDSTPGIGTRVMFRARGEMYGQAANLGRR